MDKQKFIEVMEGIKSIWFDIENFENDYDITFGEEHPIFGIVYRLVEILELECSNYNKDAQDLIEWFCWETYFGKNDYRDIVINGIKYSVITPEDLYNVLFKEDISNE